MCNETLSYRLADMELLTVNWLGDSGKKEKKKGDRE